MKTFILKATDNYELNLRIFETKEPKAIIQVMHGMEEHQGRYKKFAEELVEAGYTVITNDMRGHGEKAPELGYFGSKYGFIKVIQDQKDITKYIEETYPNVPIYIFAHSMGTITARNVLHLDSKKYTKVVLSGFPNYQAAAKIGIFICNWCQVKGGPRYKSEFVKNMAFGSFAKSVPNRKTNFDWLSYNEDNVKQYMEDPLCGYGFTVSAYRDLFELVKRLGNPKNYKNVNKEMPILLLSGEDDPCTGGYKGREKSKAVLKKAGFKNVKQIIYEKMRHEILNENERDKVVKDILEFYAK